MYVQHSIITRLGSYSSIVLQLYAPASSSKCSFRLSVRLSLAFGVYPYSIRKWFPLNFIHGHGQPSHRYVGSQSLGLHRCTGKIQRKVNKSVYTYSIICMYGACVYMCMYVFICVFVCVCVCVCVCLNVASIYFQSKHVHAYVDCGGYFNLNINLICVRSKCVRMCVCTCKNRCCK